MAGSRQAARSWGEGRWSPCRALMTAVVILASWSLGCAQLSNGGNCSHSYQLSASPEQDRRCCIQLSPALPTAGRCSTLMDILILHNGTIPAGDCLKLIFAPGSYMLPSLSQALVRYSVVMTAPQGGVDVVCGKEGGVCSEGGGGTLGEGEEQIVAMMVFNGTQREDMSVEINNIRFSHCTKQIQFDELSSLSITNSTFIGFSASALNLFNVRDISIDSCSFRDCVSSTVSRQFRGNAGALSIAYYRTRSGVDQTLSIISIENCAFYNNSAFLQDNNSSFSESDGSRIDQALNTNFFDGRGGGVGIIPQDAYFNVRARLANNVFQQNHADTFGGGLFLFIDGIETSHNFLIENCTFLSNEAVRNFGGGVHLALLLQNLLSAPTRVTIVGSKFEDNHANFGGGFCVIQAYSQGHGNEVAVEGTEFVRNTAVSVGSGIMFHTFAYVQSRLLSYSYNITDCSFSENEAPGGTFGAGFVNMNFFGAIQFTKNTGPALRLVGGLTVMNGTLSFLANKVVSNEGGALYIQEFAQVKLISGAEIEFVNNTGRIGSAIVVDVQRSSPVFSELVFNPQCFLIYENDMLPPTQWNDVFIRFSGNRASIGPVVFISHLLHCSWDSTQLVDGTSIIFDVQNFPRWHVFDYDSSNKGTAHDDEDTFDSKFYFQTQPVNITSSSTGQMIRPGEMVSLGLDGIDQFGNPTYIIARISDARSDINLGAFSQAVGTNNTNITDESILRFEPALLPVQPNVGRADIMVGFTEDVDIVKLEGKMLPVRIDTPYNVIGSTPLELNITLSTCQPGYEIKQENNIHTCQCTDSSFFILNCEEDVIVLRDGMWAGTEVDPLPHLDLAVCPTPYCRCHTRTRDQQLCETLYYQNDTELGQQCHPTRNGTLCGRCVNGTAVGVLRTNCRDCQEKSYYALGFLVVGDFIVFGLIMFAVIKLDMYFPHSLKGLLFYIQTVYYTTEHFPSAFWDVRKYMLYVSSALGLYFPYDFCLYPGMPALATFGLKFIPSAVALTVGVTVTIGAYVMRARNGRKRVWRGVWFFILLLYAPLFHNCVALLKCPVTPDASGKDEERHWLYDGEVVCFKDPAHIVLGLLAIFVLIFLVLLSPALFLFTNIVNLRKMKVKEHSLTQEWVMAALTEGYRDSREAVWWASWELFRRLMLVSIAVALPGRSVATAYVVIGCFAMHAFFKPYRKLFQNVMELVVLLNYAVLLLIRSTQTFLDSATSLGYTGTAVPDFVGKGLPEDHVIWIFIPFFYSPLVFAVFFSLGALVYRIIKFFLEKRKSKEVIIAVNAEFDDLTSSVYFNHSHDVTTTEVDGPS